MRYLLLLFCFPVAVFAQVASDANYCAESQIRRQAESVCRSDLTGREFCLTDGSARSCAYTIVIQNGTEITYCMTCIDGNQTAGGTAGGPAGGYNYQDCGFYYGDWTGCDSPIIINAADGNYPLSGPDDPVRFDLNADGNPEYATWTAENSSVAFLAMDRNGNGVIDDGSELFGNHTRNPDGATLANGFEALAAFDSNGDGVIDAADPGWSLLLLWTDRDHDGRSDASELQPIQSSPVVRLSLDYRMVGRRDEYGNFFRYEGTVQLQHGTHHIYDVFFRVSAR